MSRDRDRLLSRFRAVLLTRVQAARAALGAGSDGPQDRDVILRELHTLKGEATMLGLEALAELTHAIEEHLIQSDSTHAAGKQDRLFADVLSRMEELIESSGDSASTEEAMAALTSMFGAEVNVDASLRQAHQAGTGASPPKASTRGWTHVDARQIDRLCDDIAELAVVLSAFGRDTRRVLEREVVGAAARIGVQQEFEHCTKLLERCVEGAWRLRLVPMEPTLRELGRHVEELAEALGKKVAVGVRASGVQVESNVLDRLWEPLLHLARNAVDHGLERPSERKSKTDVGQISFEAVSEGSSIIVTVSDDGRGIDPEDVLNVAVARGWLKAGDLPSEPDLLDLLFRPGFSTRKDAGALSGRGVGLDVVRDQIEGMGGQVRLETRLGEGTRFILVIPAAITKERIVTVEVGDCVLGFPARVVRAIVSLAETGGATRQLGTFDFQGAVLPLRSLGSMLGKSGAEPFALVVELGQRRWVLAVTRIVGEENLVRSPGDQFLSRTSLFGATAIGTDGRLVLLPHLERLASQLRLGIKAEPPAKALRPQRRRVLVADDSPVIRNLVSEILTGVGIDVLTSCDGAEALSALEREAVDLVLSDLEMPKVDGFQFLEAIRRKTQELPIIVLSTRGSPADRRRAASLGANAYLVKSNFEGGALLDTIRRFMELPS